MGSFFVSVCRGAACVLVVPVICWLWFSSWASVSLLGLPWSRASV